MNDSSMAIAHLLWDETLPCATPPTVPHARHALSDDLFEQAPIGIAFTDRRGQFLRCNAAFGALLGREPAEVVHRSINDLTHEDDAAATAEQLELLWNGIVPVVDLQKRYRHQDGHALWVRATIALLRRGPSEPAIAVEYLRDISQRMRVDEALRDVSERFALAADAAGIGVWEWNIAAQTLHWDDRMYRLHGLENSRDEAPETLLSASVHIDDRAGAERELRSPPCGDMTRESEYRVVLAGDAIRYLHSSARVQCDSLERPLRVVGITFDITKRKA
ncbi:MAG: PAS domain S-box protein, partial [Pseudomonadota bacterium]|nr:PAS domain S-box protein [Pseudomonadota bacterium]